MAEIPDIPEENLRRSAVKARYEAEKSDSRLSLPFFARLPIATSMSFMAGMGLGISHGSKVAGLRFRAENAHRLPQTPTGWYLYHKSKNYNVALGGVKEGFKMGARLSIWTSGFVALENLLDEYRGTKDFFNTVGASLVVAGGFSLWSEFSLSNLLLFLCPWLELCRSWRMLIAQINSLLSRLRGRPRVVLP